MKFTLLQFYILLQRRGSINHMLPLIDTVNKVLELDSSISSILTHKHMY